GLKEVREKDSFARDIDGLRAGVASLKKQLAEHVAKREQIAKETVPGKEKEILGRTVELVRFAAGQLQETSLYLARIRLERVTVKKVDIDFPTAFLVARINRLDWMNSRAAFVDQWRLITLNANRLEAFLDIALDGDIGTFGDNAVRFRSPTGTLRARLIFDAPLNRVAERNLYRESIISYQRARRNYINYIDLVAFSLRARLRDLERLRENLEIQRLALVIAIRRVDQTLQQLNAPFTPPQPGQPPNQLSPVLATNLLRALSDFRTTQDNFTSVYFGYESSRLNLMFLLGAMRLDDNGDWIDEPVEDIVRRSVELMNRECGKRGPLVLPEELDYLGVERKPADGVIQAAYQGVEAPAAEGSREEGPRKLKITTASLMPYDEATDGPAPTPQFLQLAAALPPKSDAKAPPLAGVQEAAPPSDPSPAPAAPIAGAKPVRKTWLDGLFGDKPASGTRLSDEERGKFLHQWKTVEAMKAKGLTVEQISRATGIDPKEVRAYQAASERANLPAFTPLPKVTEAKPVAASAPPAP
ncbi:MAG TPA: hypothetical protein VNC50_11130, partial [Planctomycetia bacterium]|nr:hypothetical protein [Planctomycetia bacterium]